MNSHTRYKLTLAELEAFNSAVDNRLAELTANFTIACRLPSGNMSPERSVITAVLRQVLFALCDSFWAFLRLLKAEYVPVVRNQDNTGNVKRYSDNKEFEIKRELCTEVRAVMGRFSGITDLC